MNLLDSKTDKELLASLLEEVAKATNELRCAQQDVKKAQGRLNFVLVLANAMIERKGSTDENNTTGR